jgi:hypothetical protein
LHDCSHEQKICGLDCTFTLDLTLGCPITSLYTCSKFLWNSARYYHHL